jgi:iron complex transport system ATP-binding protein
LFSHYRFQNTAGHEMSGLTFKDIRVDIDGTSILKGISGSLNKGEMVGLIGPNGAGKTTLLRALLGLTPVKQGSAVLDGTDILTLAPKARAQLLAFAAQGAPVHWPLRVENLVALGRIPHLQPWQALTKSDKDAIDYAIDVADCAHLRGRAATTLSGGERARVLLARTIASGAPWIFADEPLASLDPLHQLQVMKILKEHARRGGGVFVAMHDLGLALRNCDRLLLLHDGQLVGQADPETILSDANLAEIFGIAASRWSVDGEMFLAPLEPITSD